MNISMSIRVLLPFKTEKFLVNKEVTLVSKLIHGDIPSYYLGTNSINSTIPIR